MDGISIDGALIREGFATAWTRDGRHRDQLVRLEREAQRQAAAKEEAERPWLVVHFDFRGPGGRTSTVGRQRVDPALVDELREWQETKEGQAKQHGWDAPSGYDPGRRSQLRRRKLSFDTSARLPRNLEAPGSN